MKTWCVQEWGNWNEVELHDRLRKIAFEEDSVARQEVRSKQQARRKQR